MQIHPLDVRILRFHSKGGQGAGGEGWIGECIECVSRTNEIPERGGSYMCA